MRNFYLICLLFALLPSFSSAQALNSWPDADSWWKVQPYDDFGNPFPYPKIFHLDGDTIIQGMTYQKVHGGTSNQAYKAATRSDNMDRVYVVPVDSTSEYLLYDFNVQVGDTIHDVLHGFFGTPLGITAVVVSYRDTINLLDGPHLRLMVEDTAYGIPREIVDGVGATSNFLAPEYWPTVSGYEALLCMARDTTEVFGTNCLLAALDEEELAGINIYPNPTSGAVRLDGTGQLNEGRLLLLNVQGKVLREWSTIPGEIELSGLNPGMYMIKFVGESQEFSRKLIKY